ncbi:unnamed protein product [[Actinomadura] parvosata subsp. kistnae]|uniref:Uncharacterized protein n=1 Tax=[Actinomadura] parvosata subsp. kistnae TaxID=1909395 RepID=A0A1V0AAI3_9ACTN|nr:hypothetical protein [Nonomuraea sp. ATCC 55076]AQZ67234.1 hypothetical protein BKM31_42445 [Nonomuraea sp. ATCC 55076]SPL94549.1 unnamed protein product [Actinomadura parvosata subsp. kistnae]
MVVIVPLVALFLLYQIPMWRDDARLDDFHERVLAIPLPPETRSAGDSEAEFGKNSGGGGDYCHYEIRLPLSTGLSAGEIGAYYRKAAITGVEIAADVRLDWGEDTADGRAVVVKFSDISSSDWDWRCT